MRQTRDVAAARSRQTARPGAPRRPRRRARAPVVAVVAVVAIAVAAAGTIVGLRLSGGGTAPLHATLARPSSYRIVYRVDTLANGSTVTTWEVLTVHRPFDSSDIVYDDDPAVRQDPPRSATWFDVDGLYTLDGSGTVRRVAGRQPGPSGNDQALGVELDALGQRRLARNTGQTRSIAGRRCDVVRFLEPPVGAIKPLTGTDHDDLCIDADGLVLAEHWVLHGRPAFARTAVRVQVGSVADPSPPAGAKPLPGNGAVPTATPGVDPDSPIAAPPTPAGYALARNDVFTLPAPTGSGIAARSTVWAFTNGPDTISVEAGTEPSGYPWDGQPTRTTAISLPGLGSATTALRSDGPEIRVALGPGRWVRIRGTVPLAVLVSYARRLTTTR